jgi:hypothetical protein
MPSNRDKKKRVNILICIGGIYMMDISGLGIKSGVFDQPQRKNHSSL